MIFLVIVTCMIGSVFGVFSSELLLLPNKICKIEYPSIIHINLIFTIRVIKLPAYPPKRNNFSSNAAIECPHLGDGRS